MQITWNILETFYCSPFQELSAKPKNHEHVSQGWKQRPGPCPYSHSGGLEGLVVLCPLTGSSLPL